MTVPRVTAAVPAALELTLQVTDVSGLLVPVTAARNCIEPPFVSAWRVELTETPVTVGISTLIGKLASLVGSAVDVAIIKSVVRVSFLETESNPLEFMEVPWVTAPVPVALELTFQVTVFSGLCMPDTEALNCKVVPVVMVWLCELIVTPVTVGITMLTVTIP